MHFGLDFFMDANNMNPDQTARSSLICPYFFFKIPKNISRRKEQVTKVVTGELRDASSWEMQKLL